MTFPATAATWGRLIREATEAVGSTMAARWLAQEVAGAPWAEIRGRDVSPEARAAFAALVDRRAAGEPLQYVVGHWAFRQLDVAVDRRVLIPRPETEVTVEVALAELDRIRAASDRDGAVAVDLGTGSGVIALALATERPGLEVWATDASDDALEVARANIATCRPAALPAIHVCPGRWWQALPDELAGRVDLVVSNPPYISTAEMDQIDAVVADWEPGSALEAGISGLEDVAEILRGASRWLHPGGAVVVEIAPHQAQRALIVARSAGLLDAKVRPDLAGRARVLVARAERTA